MTFSGYITVSEYIFRRVAQLGVKHVFGIPGDYTLHLMDYVYNVPELTYIGFCNELNAAYAADGYARIKKTPACLLTAFGVGEMSTVNAIAGAFAESVPLLHVVGTSSRAMQENGIDVHHSVPAKGRGPADHKVYQKVIDPFVCASEYIVDEETAVEKIDKVITEVWRKSLPGYIYVPCDTVGLMVSSEHLSVPLPLYISNKNVIDEDTEDQIVTDILEAVYRAERPMVLIDTLADRHRANSLIKELVDKTHILTYTTYNAKTVLDESHPAFAGVYGGDLSTSGVAEHMNSSDLVLNIGPIYSDSTTGGFSRRIEHKNLVVLHPKYVEVQGVDYDAVHFLPILAKLVARIDGSRVAKTPKVEAVRILNDPIRTGISFDELINTVPRYFQPGDTIVAEVGSVQFILPDMTFPDNTTLITQAIYMSIGYALPAAIGAAFAHREISPENPARVVLLEGDGSAQMTAQEFGTMVRYKLDISIFLLNNSGYTIERAIHGEDMAYNDIGSDWKWSELLSAMGGQEGKSCLQARVQTAQELEDVIVDKKFRQSRLTRLVEVIMHPKDYPWRVPGLIKLTRETGLESIKRYAV